MNAMIYMIFVCTNAGSCIENGGYVFHAPQDCIAQMAAMGKGHDTTLVGAKLFIGAKPYRTWYECMQRPTSQWQSVKAPDTSGAAPFKRVPYVLRHCVGAQCENSSVTSVSEQACETSRKLATEYDSSGSYECVKLQP